jgi:hypothetical protein
MSVRHVRNRGGLLTRVNGRVPGRKFGGANAIFRLNDGATVVRHHEVEVVAIGGQARLSRLVRRRRCRGSDRGGGGGGGVGSRCSGDSPRDAHTDVITEEKIGAG